MSILNNLKNAVQDKIVAKKVSDYLDKFDESHIDTIAETYSEVITDATGLLASLLTQVITSSKPALVKLAENNSSQIVKLNRIFDELGEIISSLDTTENKAILKTIGNDVSSKLDEFNYDALEAKQDKIASEFTKMIKPFAPMPKPGKFYVFNATNEHIEVTESEFKATKKLRMSVCNSFNYYEQGNDTYESVATKE